jgi:hypothetical protein
MQLTGKNVIPSRLHTVGAWLSGVVEGNGAVPAVWSEAQAGIAPADLSSDQISPQKRENPRKEAEIEYSQGGRFARVKLPRGTPGRPGRRGEIKGFTKSSRQALLRVVNSIDQGRCQPGDWAFITLTYARSFPTARASKKDLDNFFKRLERLYGPWFIIWKIEPQKRGAPHFHLLAYTPGVDLQDLLSFTARAWHEIAGGEDPNHLKWHLGLLGNDPCVQRVRDWEGVGRYAGKYMGKLCEGGEEWDHPGRFWGQRNRHLAPITMISTEIPRAQAVHVRRCCVRFYESQISPWRYLPGKKTLKGKHRPGRRIHWKQLEGVDDLDVVPRKIRMRWRGNNSGGWSGFMNAGTFERVITWAQALAPSVVRTRMSSHGGTTTANLDLSPHRAHKAARQAGENGGHHALEADRGSVRRRNSSGRSDDSGGVRSNRDERDDAGSSSAGRFAWALGSNAGGPQRGTTQALCSGR